MKKKVLVIALALSLVAVTALGVTLAYFTDAKQTTNTFTVGNVKIELREPKWNNVPFSGETSPNYQYTGLGDSTTVYAGEALDKDPQVKNIGDAITGNPCLVRILVTKPDGFSDKIILENTKYNLDTGAADDYNSTYWYKHTDGYYYYKTPLAGQQKTQPLFQRIRFVTALKGTETFATGQSGVVIRAEAVQAQGIYGKYSDLEAAMAADDWSKIVPFFSTALAQNPPA